MDFVRGEVGSSEGFVAAEYTSRSRSDWNGGASYYATVFAYLQRRSTPYEGAAGTKVPSWFGLRGQPRI
jgi:hypothetical protein